MNRIQPRLPAAVLSLLLLLACTELRAHSSSQSFSNWTIHDTSAELIFTVKSREVTRLSLREVATPSLGSLLLEHLSDSLAVADTSGRNCNSGLGPQLLPAADGYFRVRALFQCGYESPAVLRVDSFYAVAPSHIHYARVSYPGLPVQEYLFRDSRRSHTVTKEEAVNGFWPYLALGVKHILQGVDHLAFLLALLLLASRFRDLLMAITGFTLGHSITLALAVLGQVTLQIWVVEALIGFTIALVAAECVGLSSNCRNQIAWVTCAALVLLAGLSAGWGVGLPVVTLIGLVVFAAAYLSLPLSTSNSGSLRLVLTLAFGLVHGFGFANVLAEIGLPQERLALALAGFNIGVELGQLLLVALVWVVLRFAAGHLEAARYRRWLDNGSAALCTLGVYWFISRSLIGL